MPTLCPQSPLLAKASLGLGTQWEMASLLAVAWEEGTCERRFKMDPTIRVVVRLTGESTN